MSICAVVACRLQCIASQMAKALKRIFKSSTSVSKAKIDRFEWVEARDGYIPDGAVIGGEDINGEPMFVSRAEHCVTTLDTELKKNKRQQTLHNLPGKLVPSHRVCYVAFNGREFAYKNYEVLVEKPGMYWKQVSPGCLWENAVVGSLTPIGQQMFIGRAQHTTETLVIGYVNRDNEELHFPFDGREFKTKNFEYLCSEN